MRAEASTKSQIITVIEKGHLVKVLNVRGDWFSIEYRNRTGWISSSLLTSEKPVIRPAPTTTRTLPTQTVAPVRQSRAGQPTREPYVGTCDCPYDLMRNGRRCGGRSAYSRPGGRNPQCYF
ncbi:SH3 domain-containing protein [Pseudochrobactrum kiredjianiae]|nr:SH3 domain-containing protein [Pseudochrobactrum kiredjianiae]MDM7850171.1 SH3 domain-containing protein [Pseudochrobactrum kiredjianiae]